MTTTKILRDALTELMDATPISCTPRLAAAWRSGKAALATAEADQGSTDANEICQLPPIGWYCTRKAGHDGPCAAHADEPDRELDADDHACIAEGMARIKSAAAHATADAGQAPDVKFADDFAYAWDLALSDAAMYVEGHCANGAHHAEAIINMHMPKITARPAPVGAVQAPTLDAMNSASRVVVSTGYNGTGQMIFTFKTLAEMHRADDEWRARQSAAPVAPAQAVTDAERLEFVMERGAWIAWSKDGESCRLFHRGEDDEPMPMLGWGARHWSHDPREAINAAILAKREGSAGHG